MSLHRLIFDTTSTATKNASANVGAYIRSSDGTNITHTNVSGDDALDVNVSASALPTGAATEATLASLLAEVQAITFAEDSASTPGDLGVMGLAVRNDTLGTTAPGTDGDYGSLQINSTGALYVDNSQFEQSVNLQDGAGTDLTSTLTSGKQALDVNIAGSDIEIDVEDDLANTAIANAAETVTSTTGVLNTSDLANRRFIWVYNNDNQAVYIGASGVVTGDGYPVPPGAEFHARIGAAVAIHAVSDSATADVRTLQAS